MAYVGQCGTCIYFEDMHGNPYDKTNADYVKGFCTWFRASYYPDDHCDSHYRSRGSSGSNCYITTMICNILGQEDTCEALETLRSFRNDVLQKDENYAPILHEYDTVGPKIAEKLSTEDKDFVQNIYDCFIVSIVSYIQQEKKEEAISKYVEMTKSLEDCYGISYDNKMPLVYDYKNGGHGIYQKKNYHVIF